MYHGIDIPSLLSTSVADVTGLVIFFVVVWVIGVISKMANKFKQQATQRTTQPPPHTTQQPVPPKNHLISALLRDAITDYQQEQHQQQMPQPPQLPPEAREAAVRQRQASIAHRPVAQPMRESVPTQRPQRRVKRPKAVPPQAPAPVPAASVPVMLSRPAPAAPAAHRPQTPGVHADALRQWLRPATLRQQFILTEILQKPLSMREPSDW